MMMGTPADRFASYIWMASGAGSIGGNARTAKGTGGYHWVRIKEASNSHARSPVNQRKGCQITGKISNMMHIILVRSRYRVSVKVSSLKDKYHADAPNYKLYTPVCDSSSSIVTILLLI